MVAQEHDPDRTAELLAAHTQRLHHLRLQLAQLGTQAPPHIAIEIGEIELSIKRLSGEPPVVTNNDLYQVFTADSLRQDANIWKLERQMADMQKALNRLLEVALGRLPTPQTKTGPARRTNGSD